MPNFVHRDDLDADTVIPQIADNQLLLKEAFDHLVNDNLDFDDVQIRSARAEAVRRELIRALLYSSQVVINRIGFKNNPLLIDFFKQNSLEASAFQTLMRSNAIIPFFYRESSLEDGLDFSTREEGEIACKYLADQLQGDYSYCRLARDDKTNQSQTAEMGRMFSNYFLGLKTLELEQCNEMYADLTTAEEKSNDGFENFVLDLERLEKFAYENTGRGQSLQREQIYEHFFIKPGFKAATGTFRKPGDNGDSVNLFPLKKLVDLRYNSTLPDLLGRYTFVPSGMPSRLALRDFQVLRQQITQENLLDFSKKLNDHRSDIEHLMSHKIYDSMIVPIPSKMTLEDVIEIRKWDEWLNFSNSRRSLVRLGLELKNLAQFDINQNFESFINDFYAFHRKLGTWWVNKYPDAIAKGTAKQVCGAISYGLRIGPLVMTLFAPRIGLPLSLANEVVDKVIPDFVKSKVKGVSVNLLTDFFDDRQKKLDKQLSMCVELLNDNLEAERNWLQELVHTSSPDGGKTALEDGNSRSNQGRSEEA